MALVTRKQLDDDYSAKQIRQMFIDLDGDADKIGSLGTMKQYILINQKLIVVDTALKAVASVSFDIKMVDEQISLLKAALVEQAGMIAEIAAVMKTPTSGDDQMTGTEILNRLKGLTTLGTPVGKK